jgi:hypothetical protein
VVSLTLIVVGFVVATALAIVLARRSTARWERDKRAAVAARAAGSARRPPPSAVAALRSRISRFPPVPVLTRLVGAGWDQGTRRVRRPARVLRSSLIGLTARAGRWRSSRSASAPVDGDGADTPLAEDASGAADGVGGDGVGGNGVGGSGGGDTGVGGRRLFRRTGRRVSRRALAFLHRQGSPEDAPVPHGDRAESPPAGR